MENEIINVNIILATDRILRDHPNASKDQDHPTGIGHNYQYMVANSAAIDPKGTGTGDLSFKAIEGDVLRMTAVSEYNNYRTSVIMYKLFLFDRNGHPSAPIFNGEPFRLDSFDDVNTRYPSQFNPLETEVRQQAFWFAENTLMKHGTANVGFEFAIYKTPRGGEPELQGYFYWDPTITVLPG